MSIAALALYLSMLDTGTPVTPYEVQEMRAEAVRQYGFDGLRAEAAKRALFSCPAEPDASDARCAWAQAAGAFVEEP